MDKKINIEELEKQCLEAEKNFKKLSEQLNTAKKEEEQKRAEKLAAEEEARYQEVMEAKDNYLRILKAYINDYGTITIKNDYSKLEPIFGNKAWSWWF